MTAYLATSGNWIVYGQHTIGMIVSIVYNHYEDTEREKTRRSDKYGKLVPDVHRTAEVPEDDGGHVLDAGDRIIACVLVPGWFVLDV